MTTEVAFNLNQLEKLFYQAHSNITIIDRPVDRICIRDPRFNSQSGDR